MFKESEAFSGYSVNDTESARNFYANVLGLGVTDVPGMEKYGMLELHIKGSRNILLYQKDNHQPATFTVLSFPVDDIDQAVKALNQKGISMMQYNDPNVPQDELGIARGLEQNNGPDIAWFTDPAGNNLAVMQQSK